MNILHITPFFYEGLNYQEESLAFDQSEKNHSITVIKPRLKRRFEPKNQKISNDKKYRIVELESLIDFNDRLIFKNLSEIIIKINPDIVHCHCYLHPHSIQVSYICKKYNIPVIFDEHSAAFNTKSNIFLNFINLIIDLIIRKILKQPRIIFAAEDIKDFFIYRFGYSPSNSAVIRSGVPDNFLNKKIKDQSEDVRVFKLVHIGNNINERKKLEVLALLSRQNPNVKFNLKIIGRIFEEYKLFLINKFKDINNINLDFVESVPTSALAKEINGHHIAFWPGDISISALQAMSQGLVLFMTDRDNYSKHLLSSNAAFGFKEDDERDVLLQFSKLLKIKSDFKTYSKNAIEFIRKYHSWSSISDQYIVEYIKQITKNKKN